MRRLGNVLLAIGLSVSLIACSSTSSGDAVAEEASVEETAPEAEAAPAEEATDNLETESEESKEEEIPEIEEVIEEQSPYYFRDLEVVTEKYTIKITDWKVIPAGEEGNSYGDSPVLAFWYETTNTSGEKVDPSSAWIYIMRAVQDNDPNAINKLNMASHPDSSLLDNQMAEIKEGGTVANAVAYTLSDDVTPVELTASGGILGDDLGTMTFDIVSGDYTNGGSVTIGTVENAEAVDPSFKDNTIVTKDYTLEILEYRIIPAGEEGNKYSDSPIIAFWYNTTNTSGKDINPSSAWINVMTAVQDNDPNMVNKLNVAALPDSSFLDSQTATIKAGGTVENAMAYTLTDLETPVELIAKDGLFGDELGSKSFDVK